MSKSRACAREHMQGLPAAALVTGGLMDATQIL